MINEAEIRRLWDSPSLHDLLERHPRWQGATAVRAALTIPGTGARNDFEDCFIAFLDRFGLPRGAMNAGLWIGDRWIEPDCIWWEQRLIVELDGRSTHGTRMAFESDRARDRALIAAGWRVVRVTWRQLLDEPATLEPDLRAIFRAGR